MNGIRHDSPRRVSLFLSVLLVAMLLGPVNPSAVRASTDLTIGGWAVIADANGDAVRLREDPGPSYPVIASYPEGTVVEVLDGPFASDEDGSLWYHVAVDRQSGFIIADFLAPADDQTPPADNGGEEPPADDGGEDIPADDAADDATLFATGTAVIVNTNGDGIRCRAEPHTGAEILHRYVEGDVVELRGAAQNGWQPVVCAGRAGYVSAEFIGSGDEPTPGEDSGDDDDSGTSTGIGIIGNTNGDGIRCRAGAGLGSNILTVLYEGDEVPLRGGLRGDWQPVTCAGQPGFVFSDYVGPLDGDGGSDGSGGDNSGGANSDFDPGETLVVAGTNGDGVRLRARASFDGAVITVVGEGRQVEVRSGSTGDWVAVSFRGSDGFIHLDYLARDGSGGNDGNSGGGSGGIGSGDHAMATDNVRLRGDASMSGDILAVVAASTVLVVTGSTQNGFYPVDWDGLEGWMYADYLTRTDAPVTPRETGVGGDAGSGPGTSDGNSMVDYAMNYLGYPYVYATHGPNTFDCSGFTYWVTLHTLGIDISAGTWLQWQEGRPVAYGDLQPGDLVFFQNTYTWGLSHVGIYIGNNQFIHAENEQNGVRISSLTSPYYATRWYGARRIT